jgi:hypothetical protein
VTTTQRDARNATAPLAHDDPVGDRWLRWAATFFAVAVLLHNGDHARRGGDSVGTDLFWVGLLGILVEVGIVVLVFSGHRLAALAATSTGFSLAFAYVLVHALPRRGWLSDPLLESGAENASRLAAVVLILAALALGTVGTLVLRRRGGLSSATEPWGPAHPVSSVATNPVVVAMALGNTLWLAISFATL